MNARFKLNKDSLKIISLFLSWRIFLILIAIFAIHYIPLASEDRFLGGGSINYHLAPEFFSWANFDGEHYLSIATFGYKHLQQAFFPIYPLIISLLTKPFSYDLFSAIPFGILSGILISNISFLFSLIYLGELLRIDFPKNIVFLTLMVLVFFPTSFYFSAVYSESLFFLFIILSFYNARKKKWLIATFFGILASATRFFGVLLLPALFIEALQQKTNFSKAGWILLIPAGLLSYMVYLYLTIGDPLAFYNLQTVVGEQHQRGIILLPQVYFRYIKMVSTVNIYTPIYQTIILEFILGIVFLILPIYGYLKKIRLSYLFYALLGFLIPTIQGSFSSVPRYVIVLFPSFIVLALLISRLPKLLKRIFFLISASLLLIETALFLRGYWVA